MFQRFWECGGATKIGCYDDEVAFAFTTTLTAGPYIRMRKFVSHSGLDTFSGSCDLGCSFRDRQSEADTAFRSHKHMLTMEPHGNYLFVSALRCTIVLPRRCSAATNNLCQMQTRQHLPSFAAGYLWAWHKPVPTLPTYFQSRFYPSRVESK